MKNKTTKYGLASFEINEERTFLGSQKTISVSCAIFGKKSGMKFSTKKADEKDGENVIVKTVVKRVV